MKSYVFKALVTVFITVLFGVAGDKSLSIDDIFGSTKFLTRSLKAVQWMKDGRSFTFLDTDTVSKSIAVFQMEVKTGVQTMVVSGASLQLSSGDPAFRFSSYQWSPDEKSILFVSSPPEKQYLSRVTPAGNLFLYTITTKQFIRITNVAVPQYNQKFSPDSKMIGFVRENNIYCYDIFSGSEKQLTMDGTEHRINGKFDWVYEEEFGISDGWKWSPDGSRIAYWQLDEHRVPEYTLTEWDSTHLNLVTMRYPKPGDKNSVVKIGMVDLTSGTTEWIDLGMNDDIYIPRMQWTNENTVVSFQRLNRAQNTIELMYYNVLTKSIRAILKETSDTWVEVHDDLRFLKNGTFLWSSEKNGYNHLYHYKSDGTLINQITKGQWDVDAMYGIDEKNETIYYTSSEQSPMERHVYSIRLDGKKKRQLSVIPGTHSAIFSPTFDNCIATFSSVSSPPKITMNKNDWTELFSIEKNELPILKQYKLGTVSFTTFTTSDGVVLNASIITPEKFDSTKQYPVVVYTYGGPGSQVVKNAWGGSYYLWHSLLAEKGYLIFMVDNRGTGARGVAFKKIIYKKLGKWELNDQIEGAKYLASLSFVDKNRIGIWGWSYGGYMSSMAILVGSDYFRSAIAVAPVTHWKFYDTIYSERFMGTPENNPEGFTESAPLNYADKLKGRFLLIHGTSDDNVHFQNSATLVSALQQSKKQFTTMFYPNKNHGIGGTTTKIHLFSLMTDFLLENL
ncbi:MAG: alpha/beta fold hydrolase [Bacteroidetes bacterium]|nr:alpha/beta fold hydrolase [Bacteroidota bacterium]